MKLNYNDVHDRSKIGEVTVTAVERHRNGISGEGFYACTFDFNEGGATGMVAIVFLPDFSHDEDGYMTDPKTWEFHNPKVAVLDIVRLPDVRRTHNGWRGDHFAPELYQAIYEQERAA